VVHRSRIDGAVNGNGSTCDISSAGKVAGESEGGLDQLSTFVGTGIADVIKMALDSIVIRNRGGAFVNKAGGK
jgi:hypothetical protein